MLLFLSLALHYDNLLLQTREKKPRESILRTEFANAIAVINKDLSKENRLKFLHWDLNKYSRKYAVSPLCIPVSVSFPLLFFMYDNASIILSLQQIYKCVGTFRKSGCLRVGLNWIFLLSSNLNFKIQWNSEFVLHWVSLTTLLLHLCMLSFTCFSQCAYYFLKLPSGVRTITYRSWFMT